MNSIDDVLTGLNLLLEDCTDYDWIDPTNGCDIDDNFECMAEIIRDIYEYLSKIN